VRAGTARRKTSRLTDEKARCTYNSGRGSREARIKSPRNEQGKRSSPILRNTDLLLKEKKGPGTAGCESDIKWGNIGLDDLFMADNNDQRKQEN